MTRPLARRWLVAGVDEAGRGPLAGPVMAAAVILDPRRPIAGLADSKKLSPARRLELARTIRADALAWSVAWADPREIDRLNILFATMLAMRRALIALPVIAQHVQCDGNRCPALEGTGLACTSDAIVAGDVCVPAISAASIVAKVTRDLFMAGQDRIYPEYGFAQHKGYPTRAHREAIDEFGPCPIHRRSFAPIARCHDASRASSGERPADAGATLPVPGRSGEATVSR